MSKLISRTFINTEVTLKGLTTDENGNDIIATEVYVINGDIDKKDIDRYLFKNYKGNLLGYRVMEVNKVEELRGIEPEVFYKYSVKLDNETRKPIE